MGQTLDNKGDGDMATWLNDYKAYKEALSQEFEGGAVAIGKVLQYQELLYRIDVLETCQMLCKTAPVTMDIRVWWHTTNWWMPMCRAFPKSGASEFPPTKS